jgi:hypothetical protein
VLAWPGRGLSWPSPLTDPFYIDQSVSPTRTLSWIDAFTSEPSAYAVPAASSACARLVRVEERRDRRGLFFGHQGVGSGT